MNCKMKGCEQSRTNSSLIDLLEKSVTILLRIIRLRQVNFLFFYKGKSNTFGLSIVIRQNKQSEDVWANCDEPFTCSSVIL